MEPLHGARPKCNRLGRPTLELEEPRGLGAEATGGIDSLKATEGGMRAPACHRHARICRGGSSHTPEERC